MKQNYSSLLSANSKREDSSEYEHSLAEYLNESGVSHRTTNLDIKIESRWKPIIFFLLAGFLSRSVDTLMIAKSDQFEVHYKDYYYRYLVASPTYIAIPLTFIFVKIASPFSLIKRMLFCSFGVGICMLVTLKLIFFVEGKMISYIILFVFYYLAFIFQTAL